MKHFTLLTRRNKRSLKNLILLSLHYWFRLGAYVLLVVHIGDFCRDPQKISVSTLHVGVAIVARKERLLLGKHRGHPWLEILADRELFKEEDSAEFAVL